MEFYRRSGLSPRTLGVLAGSFNPPTVAHLEIARAAGLHVDEVLCVVPKAFPHKDYFGATLEQRVNMLELAGLAVAHSIASSDQGLFIDIARECRRHYDPDIRIYIICGRDAAERILTWDYGRPGVVEEMLEEFELLVAPRGGLFHSPPEFERRVHLLDVGGAHDGVSSSELRGRIAVGEAWEHLAPEGIRSLIREIYS